jgi:hypothetical protein
MYTLPSWINSTFVFYAVAMLELIAGCGYLTLSIKDFRECRRDATTPETVKSRARHELLIAIAWFLAAGFSFLGLHLASGEDAQKEQTISVATDKIAMLESKAKSESVTNRILNILNRIDPVAVEALSRGTDRFHLTPLQIDQNELIALSREAPDLIRIEKSGDIYRETNGIKIETLFWINPVIAPPATPPSIGAK